MNFHSKLKPMLSRDELLDQAREVGELAFRYREETERERRMPDRVMDALRASGLVKLLCRRKWGGLESDPMTFLEVGREIARNSTSLGWLYTLLGFHEWYMSFASDELQQDVWGKDPDAFVCDSFAPVGDVERVSDGYVVSGRWRFASGIEWSSWIGVGGVAVAPDGERPEHQLFFIPRSDVVVEDDWNTLGLKGSASRAVAITRAFVPDHRAFAIGRLATATGRGARVNDGPLWRVPLMGLQGLAVLIPTLGTAQRVVEEFHVWTKARHRPYEGGAAASEAAAPQIALAAGATQWDACYALAQKYAQEGWDRAVRGESWVLSEEERATLFAWRSYIARASIELTDQLFIGSGAMVCFDSHPLQQLFRDIHTCGVHIGIDRADAYTSRGRVAMGGVGHPFN